MFHVRYLCDCGFGVLVGFKGKDIIPKFRKCQVCGAPMVAESMGESRDEYGRPPGAETDFVKKALEDAREAMAKPMNCRCLTNKEFQELLKSFMKGAAPKEVGNLLDEALELQRSQKNPMTEKVPFLGTGHEDNYEQETRNTDREI